jgi:hypothetical protein
VCVRTVHPPTSQSRSHVSFVVVARSKAAPSRQPPNESHTHSSRHLTVRERTCRRQTRVDLTVACGWMWTDRQTKAVRRLGTRAANTYVTDGSMLRSGRPGPGPGPAVMLRQRVRGRRNGPELRLGSFVLPRTPRGRRSGRNSGTWMARAEFPCGCCCSHAVVIDSSLSTVIGVSCNTTHVQWDETEKVCAQRSAQVQT